MNRGDPEPVRKRTQKARAALELREGRYHECPVCGAPRFIPADAGDWRNMRCLFHTADGLDRAADSSLVLMCVFEAYAGNWRKESIIAAAAAPEREWVVKELLRQAAIGWKANSSGSLNAYADRAMGHVLAEARRRVPAAPETFCGHASHGRTAAAMESSPSALTRGLSTLAPRLQPFLTKPVAAL